MADNKHQKHQPETAKEWSERHEHRKRHSSSSDNEVDSTDGLGSKFKGFKAKVKSDMDEMHKKFQTAVQDPLAADLVRLEKKLDERVKELEIKTQEYVKSRISELEQSMKTQFQTELDSVKKSLKARITRATEKATQEVEARIEERLAQQSAELHSKFEGVMAKTRADMEAAMKKMAADIKAGEHKQPTDAAAVVTVPSASDTPSQPSQPVVPDVPETADKDRSGHTINEDSTGQPAQSVEVPTSDNASNVQPTAPPEVAPTAAAGKDPATNAITEDKDKATGQPTTSLSETSTSDDVANVVPAEIVVPKSDEAVTTPSAATSPDPPRQPLDNTATEPGSKRPDDSANSGATDPALAAASDAVSPPSDHTEPVTGSAASNTSTATTAPSDSLSTSSAAAADSVKSAEIGDDPAAATAEIRQPPDGSSAAAGELTRPIETTV